MGARPGPGRSSIIIVITAGMQILDARSCPSQQRAAAPENRIKGRLIPRRRHRPCAREMTGELTDAEALRIARLVWSGDVNAAFALLDAAPEASLRSMMLRAQAHMLLAALTGDLDDAAAASLDLHACIDACRRVEAPETWGKWAASWVMTTALTAPQLEASGLRAMSEMMLAVTNAMLQQWLQATLALRRALVAFAALPPADADAESPDEGEVAPPTLPPSIRNLGAGLFSLLLALLPRPVAQLLTLSGSFGGFFSSGGGISSMFGGEEPSEALGYALLLRACETPSRRGNDVRSGEMCGEEGNGVEAAVGGGDVAAAEEEGEDDDEEAFDGGAAWCAQCLMLAFASSRSIDRSAQSQARSQAAEQNGAHAAVNGTGNGSADDDDSAAELKVTKFGAKLDLDAVSHVARTLDERIDALDKALPNSLLISWMACTVRRSSISRHELERVRRSARRSRPSPSTDLPRRAPRRYCAAWADSTTRRGGWST